LRNRLKESKKVLPFWESDLRQIQAGQIGEIVERLCLKANYDLRADVLQGLREALPNEKSDNGREILRQIIENAGIAKEESLPICQDTGFVTVFLEIGQEVLIVGADLFSVIEQAVRNAYTEGHLRPSVVSEPCFSRTNSGDNTPPLVYTSVSPGNRLKITVMPKGGGSENMSQVNMLPLVDPLEGISRFVLSVIERAGANACPPMIVGLGIGGTFDSVGLLAKKALLKPIDERHRDPRLADLEKELFKKVNKLGTGPGGLGGCTTILGVNTETHPTHMACLPVAVNLSCHALRSAEEIV
jgi:fumarate hydratase subunit alpha